MQQRASACTPGLVPCQTHCVHTAACRPNQNSTCGAARGTDAAVYADVSEDVQHWHEMELGVTLRKLQQGPGRAQGMRGPTNSSIVLTLICVQQQLELSIGTVHVPGM